MMKKEAWNFPVWKQLQENIYRESLSAENLLKDGSEEFYEIVYQIDENHEQYEYTIHPPENRHCVLLSKGNEKYVLPAKWAKDLPIKPKKWFKCQLKKSDKSVWRFIEQPSLMKISGEKQGTFKEFIDSWNPLKHTSQQDWTFLKLVAIAARYKGIKICLCGPAACGKNANFTIIGAITEDICRIARPTLAKFETVCFYNKVVLPDEVTSMTPKELRDIEPTILTMADNSPDHNKHSMAKVKSMNKIDLSQLSIVFTYNRVKDLSDGATFFDDCWQSKSAFKSRFPQFLLNGVVDESLPNLNPNQARIIMKENYDDLRVTAKEAVYWIENLHTHLHGYRRVMVSPKHRHMSNMEGLLDVIDAYSESQDEFDKWQNWMRQSLMDYKKMVQGTLNISDYTAPSPVETVEVEEEKVPEKVDVYAVLRDRMLAFCREIRSFDEIKEELSKWPLEVVESMLEKQLREGNLFSPKPDHYKTL